MDYHILWPMKEHGAGLLIRGPDFENGWMVMWIKDGQAAKVKHSRWWLFAMASLLWFRVWRCLCPG